MLTCTGSEEQPGGLFLLGLRGGEWSDEDKGHQGNTRSSFDEFKQYSAHIHECAELAVKSHI